jgi:glutamyl-Q tRNA(Asp) synthetase
MVEFDDRIQGHQQDILAETTGDFILLRADGFFAYQLAVVVDDEAQGVTHVVRGEDLLESTGRQILLQRLLGYRTPLSYAHIPVVRDDTGDKLSKQTHAPPVDPRGDDATLREALRFLHVPHPPDLTIRDFPTCNLRLINSN